MRCRCSSWSSPCGSSVPAIAAAIPKLGEEIHSGCSGKFDINLAANHEAEDFYLKGRFYSNKRTAESLNQAVEAFSQAIARNPNYSEAYVGLSDSYNLLREFSVMPANEAYFKAFAAAKKAVELDPQSADAHASLAFVNFWGMWDTQDAEKEFRRSIELDPNSAKAHHWFATFLHALGQPRRSARRNRPGPRTRSPFPIYPRRQGNAAPLECRTS